MSFDPEYGETLVAEEDLESLTERARAVVGDPVRKADVYDVEQAISELTHLVRRRAPR